MIRIIANYHCSLDAMHSGVGATYDKLKKIYEFENMKQLVAEYIKTCQLCQKNKRDYNHKNIPLHVVSPRSNSSFETIYIDVVGPLVTSTSNNRFIITMLCELTRFLIAVAVPETDSNTIAQVIVQNLYMPYSQPKTLICDNAKNLNSEIMIKLCKLLKVKKINTTIYHPESNLVEASHGPLKVAIKSYIDKQLDNFRITGMNYSDMQYVCIILQFMRAQNFHHSSSFMQRKHEQYIAQIRKKQQRPMEIMWIV